MDKRLKYIYLFGDVKKGDNGRWVKHTIRIPENQFLTVLLKTLNKPSK